MICDKTMYTSYKEAQAAAAHVAAKQRKGMKTYKCNECGHFHIATMRPRTNMGRKPFKYKDDWLNYKPMEIVIPKPHKSKGQQKKIETTYKPFAYFKSPN